MRFWLTRNWSMIEWGNRAMMPMKMISEIPFPIPRSVICSPSHIMNIVPDVRKMIVPKGKSKALDFDRDDRLPFDGKTGQPHAHTPRLQCRHEHCPVPGQLRELLAPFFAFLRKLLEIRNHRAQELKMIDALIYGMMPRAKIGRIGEGTADEEVVQAEERVGRLVRLRPAPADGASTPGKRNVCSHAHHHQQERRGKQDAAAAEFLDLEDIAKLFA